MKCDLHVHSFASYDSLSNKDQILSACHRNGIKAIAITDHNEIYGATMLQKKLPLKVIVGEEITTESGEIIGLFLKRKINSGLTLKETIREIKRQNGVVYLPHPFDFSTGGRKSIGKKDAIKYIADIDLIEIFNSRTFFESNNKVAKIFAEKYKKFCVSGSDAHTSSEIGLAGIEIENFENKEDFLLKIKKAIPFGRKTFPWVYFITKLVRGIKFLRTTL